MSAFSSRSKGYKVGVIMLMFATGIYIVGFGAPYWTKVEFTYTRVTVNEGLWMVCVTGEVAYVRVNTCVTHGVRGQPAWFHVVRALLGVCTIGLITACIFALATNCCRTFPGPRTRFIEILGALSGLAGFVGCMVYAVMRIQYTFPNWAFFLATISSALSVMASVIVTLHNRQPDQQGHTGDVVMTTVTAQPGYAPQQPYGGPYSPSSAHPPPKPYFAQPGKTGSAPY